MTAALTLAVVVHRFDFILSNSSGPKLIEVNSYPNMQPHLQDQNALFERISRFVLQELSHLVAGVEVSSGLRAPVAALSPSEEDMIRAQLKQLPGRALSHGETHCRGSCTDGYYASLGYSDVQLCQSVTCDACAFCESLPQSQLSSPPQLSPPPPPPPALPTSSEGPPGGGKTGGGPPGGGGIGGSNAGGGSAVSCSSGSDFTGSAAFVDSAAALLGAVACVDTAAVAYRGTVSVAVAGSDTTTVNLYGPFEAGTPPSIAMQPGSCVY